MTPTPFLRSIFPKRDSTESETDTGTMATKVIGQASSTKYIATEDWWGAHPWEEIKPYALVGAVSMVAGLFMVGRARAGSQWLKTPSKVFYLTGLAILTYSGLLALPSEPTKGLSILLGLILVPLGVISTAMYVFGSGEPASASAVQPERWDSDSRRNGDEESVPLTEVERDLKD